MSRGSPASNISLPLIFGGVILAGTAAHAFRSNVGFWRGGPITTSATAAASVVPSDGLAQAFFTIYPRNASNVAFGAGQTVEVTASSATVTVNGAGACRTPAANCAKAIDAGGGFYYANATSSTVQSATFTTVVAGTPDYATGSSINVTFDSSQYTTISANTTITAASHAGKNLYFTGGTATFDSSTVGQTFGHLFVRGGTLTHSATTTATVYKIDVNAASLTLQSGTFNVNNLGYTAGYSFGSSGPSTSVGSGSLSGGSHGGKGGNTNAGPVYDDYRNPSYPGGGASSSASGGGVVRLTVSGSCTVISGASITANGQTSGSYAGAGGSVYMRCGSFAGTAAANAITAKGATAAGTTGSGGGGRIALISTGDASSFTGSFAYASALATFKSVVRAEGAPYFNSGYGGGGAGTIYVKHTGLTYGDLIIDNKNPAYSAQSGNTPLVSMYGTVSSSTSTTLTVAETPALTTGHTNLYAGMRLRPDVSYTNGTTNDWTDDNVLTVSTNNTSSLLTMTGSFSGVADGATFRSIDIFDHLEMDGSSVLESYGDIYVSNGSLTAPGSSLSITNSMLSFNGSGSVYPTVTNYVFNSGTFSISNGLTSSNSIQVSGANVTTASLNSNAVSVSSGSLTTASITSSTFAVSGGTATIQNLTTTGDVTISGGTVTHPATTSTTVYKVQGSIGGNLSMTGGAINVNNLGYLPGYSYGPSAPSTSLASGSLGGGSHGGKGGNTNAGPVYDDYRNPSYPGGGAPSSASGGGVVRLTVTGSCTINSGASITANGQTGSSYAGAGGSIYLNCASFAGTAAANAITAKGATAAGTTGSGGGGRIALISTGNASSFTGSFAYASALATFKSVVRAEGGPYFNATYGGGGAGTIYTKHSDLTYGDLIIDNKNPAFSAQSGNTPLVSMYGTVSSSTSTTLTVSETPTLAAGYTNLYSEMRLRPDISYTNGTTNDWTDDNIVTVASNDTTSTLTMTASFSGVANGATFRSIDIFDHLEMDGSSVLESYGDIYVLNGSLTSPGATMPITNAMLSFNGSGSVYPPVTDYTFTSGTFNISNGIAASGNVIVNGATVTTASVSANGVTVSAGSLTTATVTSATFAVSGGTATIQNLTTTGDVTISGGTVAHPATTSTTVYKILGSIGGNLSMTGGTINVNNLGYLAGYSYGSSTPSTSLASGSASGGSHGGKGGYTNAGPVYDDYRNPSFPGGGGYSVQSGGGVVRLTVTGSCTINTGASITANGQGGGYAGAGGSIYMQCASFGGTAAANAITAKGGASGAAGAGSGGGGRIALISTGNAASFTGSFAYTSALATFKSVVRAEGAPYFNSGWGGGGAGTIYVKHSGLTYGDLIIDNKNPAYSAQSGNTPLVSMYGTVSSSTSTTLTVSETPTLAAGYTNLYSEMRVRPDVSYTNGTPNDWTDDNVLTVSTNNTSSLLTMTGSFSGVADGATFRSIDIFDHLEMDGSSVLESYGDIYVLNGSLTAPGSNLSITNSILSFLGTGSVYPTVSDYSFTSGTLSITPGLSASNSITVNGGTITAGVMSAPSISIASGSLTTPSTSGSTLSVSGGTLTVQNITTTGDFTVSGGTVTHPATTSTTVYKIQGTIGGNLSMTGGAINVNNLGYLAGYSYGPSAPSTSLASGSLGGGSHGGKGGNTNAGLVYDDYRNPSYPGGGAPSSASGGGVVRMSVTGSCTINSGASITANGQTSGSYAGAGGSIYLNCASFAGTAAANAITAKGATAAGTTGSGGGGRIALVSTGNAASFSGSFDYASALSSFKSVVRAEGGPYFNATYGGGGAGTIYIKHAGLTHGDLIVDNKNNAYSSVNGNTRLLSMYGTVTSSTSTTLTVTETPALAAGYTNLYSEMKLRPDVSYTNGTPNDWTDDNILTVSTNDTTSLLTMTGSFSGVSNGVTFRSIDIFDHLELDGTSVLETYGDIYVLSGTLSSPGTLSYTNNMLSFLGTGSVYPTVTDYSFTSGTLSITPGLSASNSITVNGGTITTGSMNAPTVSLASGSLTTTSTSGSTLSVSGGTLTVQNVTTTGDFTVSGGTVTHPATTSTTVYKIQGTIGGNLSMTGGTINVNNLGYTSGYSYGSSAPSTSLASGSLSGGSHGGKGGYTNSGPVYDDYRDPSYPGGGAPSSASGGGVVRMSVTGSCTINSGASITANGQTSGSYAGAGGSIYLNCASFAGTAAANAITAKGATAAGTTGSGGGGRIALISTGDASSFTGSFAYASALAAFKSVVRTEGGPYFNATYGGGGAGTIYLKHSGLTYGDLIIDNNNNTAAAANGKTAFVATTANSSTIYSSTTTKLQITSASTPLANMTNLFTNQIVQVFTTASTPNPLDSSHYEATLTSNDTNNFYATAASFPAISSDHYYRFVTKVDHLELSGNATVDLSGGDLMLMTGASQVCDLHSSTNGVIDIPTGSSLTGNSLASTNCSGSAKTGTFTFTNTYMAP